MTAASERETHLSYNDADDLAYLDTSRPSDARRLMRLGLEPARLDKDARGRTRTWFFTMPKSWIAIRPPRRLRLTPEQRQALSDRLSALKKPQVSLGKSEESPAAKGITL